MRLILFSVFKIVSETFTFRVDSRLCWSQACSHRFLCQVADMKTKTSAGTFDEATTTYTDGLNALPHKVKHNPRNPLILKCSTTVKNNITEKIREVFEGVQSD